MNPSKTTFANWIAVFALSMGIFTLVVIEQLPIGVLTLISSDLQVSNGTAGLTVTFPGVIAGIIALLVPGLTKGLNRKSVLLIALLATLVSCVASALAPNFWVLMTSRIFTGLAIGFYWPVLPLLASAQVAKVDRGKALTLAYAGTGSALVLGLPLVTWLGTWQGWRGSFWVTGILALAVALAVLITVKPMRPTHAESVRSTFNAFKIRGVRYAFTLTCVLITSQFIAYSYISPIFQEKGGVLEADIGTYLLIYGVCGLIGNFVIGPTVSRLPVRGILVLTIGTVFALLFVMLVLNSVITAAVAAAIWGFFGGMASVSIQSMVMAEAGERAEAGTALNSAAYNIAIGGGAVIGGVLMDTAGMYAVLTVALAGYLAGLGIIAKFQAPCRGEFG